MEPSRVVEVYCAGGRKVGTGYLTTGGTVLTAWHVVEAAGPGGLVKFRALIVGGPVGRWYQAAVVWPVPEALPCEVDVALLAICDPEWQDPGIVPVRWGRVVGLVEVPVLGVGFPDAAKDRRAGSTARDTLPLRGHIDPLAHAKSGARHVVVGLTGPLVPARKGSSPWSGASGAALFADGTDILLAVTVTDHELAIDARTLTATPVTALAAAYGFAAVAAVHGIVVEPVDVSGHPPGPSPARLPAPGQVPVPAGLSNIAPRQVFVGRVEELDALRTAMGSGTGTGVVTQAVSGLGGIGKTTLAAEYARRHAGDYRVTWALTADTKANAEKDLAGLARGLCPGATSGLDDTMLADWALSWLQGHPGWLLVWDNVDDLEEVLPLYRGLAGGHHLVTSRRTTGWQRIGVARPLRLGELEPGDAADLLTALAGPGLVGDAAGELCTELGFLPLAVEQVGAYLAEAGVTAGEYLERWRTVQGTVAKAPESMENDRIMTGVWRITLDKLADTPLAGDVLRAMAWLAPDAIPRTLLATAAGDSDGVAEALRRLNAYSMVTLHPGGTVSVHRVVQAVTRTPDPADPHRRPEDVTAAQNTAIEILATQVPSPALPAADAVARWRLLLPHIDAFAGHAAGRAVTPDTVTVMDQTFNFLRDQGNPAAGIRIAACSLAGEMQHHGPDHPGTLRSRNNLARAYESAGYLGKAIELYEAVLADRVRVQGPDHPNTLTSQNNLAGAYKSAGDVGKAIELFEAVLADEVRVLGPDDPATLRSRNNLAGAYDAAGDVGKAIELYEAVLADEVRVQGTDHPDTLTLRNNLASAYISAGDVERAIELFEAVLADRVRGQGTDHPNTLGSRNNLASAYISAGNVGKAIELFEAVLANQVRVLGPDHPDTLTSQNNLAYAYSSVGDVGKAIELFEAVLANQVRVLGPDHPDTLRSRNNLAGAYESAGDVGKAIELFEAVVADQVRILGLGHPDTLGSRNDLAGAHISAGNVGKAIELYEAVVADQVRVLGPDHPDTLRSRNNLAGAHISAGNVGNAIELFEAVLADRVRILGTDHWHTLTSRSNLAYAYFSAGDAGKAIELYEQTLADQIRVLGENHPDTLASRNNLAYAIAQATATAHRRRRWTSGRR